MDKSGIEQEGVEMGWERKREEGRNANRETKNRHNDIRCRLKSSSSSVGPIRDLVPEERVAGGSEGLSLLRRKRFQKALEFVREESGWWSALGLLPAIEVLEDSSNHTGLFDHRDDFKSVPTFGTLQRVDFIDLAEQPRPAAPPLLGEALGRRVLLRVRRRGGAVAGGPGGGLASL